MIKLVPVKWYVSGAAVLTIVLLTTQAFLLEVLKPLSGELSIVIGVLDSARTVVVFVWLIFAALLWKPIWTRVWRCPFVGPWLSNHFFPDLNGEWDVVIQSNWPTIEMLRKAAKTPTEARFDVLDENTKLPPPGVVQLKATIDQGWSRSTVTIEPNSQTPMRRSKTLALDLIPAADDQPKRIAWIFRQENASVAPTDEGNFLGAALLQVGGDPDILQGQYWSNRSWRKGLNAAGEIELRRRKSRRRS